MLQKIKSLQRISDISTSVGKIFSNKEFQSQYFFVLDIFSPLADVIGIGSKTISFITEMLIWRLPLLDLLRYHYVALFKYKNIFLFFFFLFSTKYAVGRNTSFGLILAGDNIFSLVIYDSTSAQINTISYDTHFS